MKSSSQQRRTPGELQPWPSGIPTHCWEPRRADIKGEQMTRARLSIGIEKCIDVWFLLCFLSSRGDVSGTWSFGGNREWLGVQAI